MTAIHPDEGRFTRSKYRWETKNIVLWFCIEDLNTYLYTLFLVKWDHRKLKQLNLRRVRVRNQSNVFDDPV